MRKIVFINVSKLVIGLFVSLLFSHVTVSAQTNPLNRIIITQPEEVVSSVGNNFELFITLDSGVTNVHGYRVKLKYDTAIIRLDTIVPTATWSSIGAGFFAYKNSIEIDSISSDSNWFYDIGSYYLGQSLHIDGYSDVARLQFTALKSGASLVYFDFVLVQDTLLNIVTENWEGAAVFVCPFPTDFPFYGDLDGTGNIDIADLTFLIDHLFINFPPIVPLKLLADVDCDGAVDISDLTMLIDHLFISFIAICNPCP